MIPIIYHYQQHGYRWSWTDFQLRAQMKKKVHENNLNPGDGETIAEFCRNYNAL